MLERAGPIPERDLRDPKPLARTVVHGLRGPKVETRTAGHALVVRELGASIAAHDPKDPNQDDRVLVPNRRDTLRGVIALAGDRRDPKAGTPIADHGRKAPSPDGHFVDRAPEDREPEVNIADHGRKDLNPDVRFVDRALEDRELEVSIVDRGRKDLSLEISGSAPSHREAGRRARALRADRSGLVNPLEQDPRSLDPVVRVPVPDRRSPAVDREGNRLRGMILTPEF